MNITAPPDPSETSALATYRRGSVAVRSGVAQHVVFATGRGGGDGGGGGGGYPGALLGVIAFARQSFLDAQWQKDAHAFADRHKDAPVASFEPAIDSLAPALDRRMPVAFEAAEEREIVRALAFAKEFNLIPSSAAPRRNVIDELKAAKARVICVVELPGHRWRRWTRFGAGRGGGPVDTPIRVTRMRQNAVKVPATLEGRFLAFTMAVSRIRASSRSSVARIGRRKAGSPRKISAPALDLVNA